MSPIRNVSTNKRHLAAVCKNFGPDGYSSSEYVASHFPLSSQRSCLALSPLWVALRVGYGGFCEPVTRSSEVHSDPTLALCLTGEIRLWWLVRRSCCFVCQSHQAALVKAFVTSPFGTSNEGARSQCSSFVSAHNCMYFMCMCENLIQFV